MGGQIKRIAVFGAGGHGKVVVDAIQRQGSLAIACVVDDRPLPGQTILGEPVAGGRPMLLERRGEIDGVIVAIGDNRDRARVANWLRDQGFELASVVHPAAVVAPSATIGAGCLLMPGSVVNAYANIGANVIVNSGAVVEHDCEIGEHAHIAPGAVLCGAVSVGAGTLIGAGAVVLPEVRIGREILIKAGSVIARNVENGNMSNTGVSVAIGGGKPIRAVPFPPWPVFGEDEIRAAADVLASGRVNYWTGEVCRRFEEEFAAFAGVNHAITLANGTLALEVALHAMGIGPGDEVVVPARTYIASASCAVACGAVPVVADVDPVSQTLTAESVRAVLSPRTRAIVAVHLAGWPCDMDSILALARERGIRVLEDCAQAHGATYKGRPVGSLGDCAAFSFCQDKIMTTGGEGGMLLTNDTALWERAWAYKDHGKSYEAVMRQDHPPGFRWLHESFGSNFRMTEMQAAIGRLQLAKLPGWLATRRRNAALLDKGFAGIPALRLTIPPPDIGHAYYKYYAFLDPAGLASGWDIMRIIETINAEGVPCYSGSCSEIYLERAFRERGWGPSERLPVAKRLGEASLMFLVHPTLGEAEMADTICAVGKVMKAALR